MPVNSFDDYYMSWKPEKEKLERPYYLSLAQQLERDITDGFLPENTKLPPQRELADYLDLNLSTVTRAYKLCELKGLLYGVTGSGTFVAPGIRAKDTFLDKDSPQIEMGMIKPFYETDRAVRDAARAILERRMPAGCLNTAVPWAQSVSFMPPACGSKSWERTWTKAIL